MRYQDDVDLIAAESASQGTDARQPKPRNQQPLRSIESLRADIFETMPAAVVCLDAEGTVVDVNSAALVLIQRRPHQVLGHNAGRLLPARHARRWRAWLRMRRLQLDGGHPTSFCTHVLRGDGQDMLLRVDVQFTRVDERQIHVASISPVSGDRGVAQESSGRHRTLEHNDRLSVMGSLLAGVAHELNNPMAIALGRATLLQEKCRDPGLRGDAGRIRDAVERCVRITRSFLNMARARPPRRVHFHLNDTVRSATLLLQPLCRSHRIELDRRLADDLPPLMGDPDQVSQIVVNLLVNAQQAMECVNGARRIVLTSGADKLRRTVWLQVRDSGPGIPSDVREQLFQPFVTTKPEGEGTGLGLPLSQALARANGGELSLEPAAGQGGAVFRLSLPVSAADTTDGADAEAAPLPSPQKGTGARILLVDDEPELLNLMRSVLERAGHEVITALSGEVAIARLAEAKVDAIVSDFRMPQLDGAGLWRHVKRHRPSLADRMVFVTGDTLSPSVCHFFAASGCSCLEKPFSREALLGAVAALLTGRQPCGA